LVQLKKEIEEQGDQAVVLEMDVTDAETMNRGVQSLVKTLFLIAFSLY